jgi:hypothetical protein
MNFQSSMGPKNQGVIVSNGTTKETLIFHVIENVILFRVEIIRFTYMITFIIYHENL